MRRIKGRKRKRKGRFFTRSIFRGAIIPLHLATAAKEAGIDKGSAVATAESAAAESGNSGSRNIFPLYFIDSSSFRSSIGSVALSLFLLLNANYPSQWPPHTTTTDDPKAAVKAPFLSLAVRPFPFRQIPYSTLE